MNSIHNLIQANKILVCIGRGGVGKTTLSAALALKASFIGKKVLLLTLDPSHRLATSLGISLKDGEIKKVKFKGLQLDAGIIIPSKILVKFINSRVNDEGIRTKLWENKLFQQLAGTLSGSQEFTSLAEVLSSAKNQNYDLIILDTPPSQHAIDFLTAPERLNAVFDQSVVKWFTGQNLFGKAAEYVLKSLGKITGSEFINELVGFFKLVQNLDGEIRTYSTEIEEILKNEQTKFILIDSVERERQLTHNFSTELSQRGYHFAGTIMNRTLIKLNYLPKRFQNADLQEISDIYCSMQGQSQSGSLVNVAAYPKDVHGLEDLEKLALSL